MAETYGMVGCLRHLFLVDGQQASTGRAAVWPHTEIPIFWTRGFYVFPFDRKKIAVVMKGLEGGERRLLV